jgi:CCR4-NOT transcription complex subunit 6
VIAFLSCVMNRSDFKGIIDYIFHSRDRMRPLGLLGSFDVGWFADNRIVGCPNTLIPSDHLPLLVEFELNTGAIG